MKNRVLYKTEVIDHENQEYNTCGNWKSKNGKLDSVIVSDTGNDDYSFALVTHEVIEAWLCLRDGITQEEVDEFDKAYELSRENYVTAPCGCKPTDVSEPGDDKHAPYFKYHQFATKIEKMVIRKMQIDWSEYEKTIDAL